MGIPLILEFVVEGKFPLETFLLPMVGCVFTGVALIFSNQLAKSEPLETEDAFFLTSLTWLAVPFLAGLPFFCSPELHLPFIDAWFEAVSDLTTTGFSIIRDTERIPRSIVFWRFLLCYFGGVGIMLMGMIVVPILRIGGMQVFHSESSDRTEKILPKVSKIAFWILIIYSSAIALEFAGLRGVGLSTLDALCHAVSAISTSGLSTRANSVQDLANWGAEFVLILGMVLGGSPLLLYFKLFTGKFTLFLRDEQFRGYLKWLGFLGLGLSFLRWNFSDLSLLASFRQGFFNAISLCTTTGFYNDNYEYWGPFAMIIFPLLSLVGGCTGSTAGGIKIFRFQILGRFIKQHILQLRRSHGVFVPSYNGQKVPDFVVVSIFVFTSLFCLSLAVSSVFLALCGLDFTSALSVAIASLSNVGAGIGPTVGQGVSLAQLSPSIKIILMINMILGRLELLTLLTLLIPFLGRKR
jgi:trk system potassium uptake protein TrkH